MSDVHKDLTIDFPEFIRKTKEQNSNIFMSEVDLNKKNIVTFDFSTILKGEWNRPKNDFIGYKIKVFVKELYINNNKITSGNYELICNLSFMQCVTDNNLAIKNKKTLMFRKLTRKTFEIKEV